MNSLYVITPVFNPFRFKSRIRLYQQFARHMESSGAKLFTVEAAFGEQPFEVTTADNPMNLQLRTNQVLWHKERLINLAEKALVHRFPDVRCLGWFDSDVTFVNEDWVAETLHNLSHLSVLQPFSQAINLNSTEEAMWTCPSSFEAFLTKRGYHQHPPLPVSYTYKGHPGLAWCATRAAFEAMGGLFDCVVSGSADTVMSNSLKGDWSAYLPGQPSPGLRSAMSQWSDNAQSVVRGKIGYTRGALLHHWHGRSEARGYEKRWDIMSFHQFDPTTDLATDSNGMHRWAGNKPKLEDDIRFSLSSRNEDEI